MKLLVESMVHVEMEEVAEPEQSDSDVERNKRLEDETSVVWMGS